MSLFLLRCLDNENASAARAAGREGHLAHVRGSGRTMLAGPLLDGEGKVVGSMLVVEAEDLDDAQTFSLADPYRQQGVYRDVEIHPMKLTYVALATEADSAKDKP